MDLSRAFELKSAPVVRCSRWVGANEHEIRFDDDTTAAVKLKEARWCAGQRNALLVFVGVSKARPFDGRTVKESEMDAVAGTKTQAKSAASARWKKASLQTSMQLGVAGAAAATPPPVPKPESVLSDSLEFDSADEKEA